MDTFDESFDEDFEPETMMEFSDEAYDLMGDTLIGLSDENGNSKEFCVLDVINYKGFDYLVLIDAEDEDDDVSEVTILKQIDDGDADEEGLCTYEAVEDEDEMHSVFNLFKSNNKEIYKFIDLK